jgi:hypothetical protein
MFCSVRYNEVNIAWKATFEKFTARFGRQNIAVELGEVIFQRF